MRVSWYNRPQRFDHGIVWVKVRPTSILRKLHFFGGGWGLWFCRCFPYVWPLTPWTCAPGWLHDRAIARACR